MKGYLRISFENLDMNSGHIVKKISEPDIHLYPFISYFIHCYIHSRDPSFISQIVILFISNFIHHYSIYISIQSFSLDNHQYYPIDILKCPIDILKYSWLSIKHICFLDIWPIISIIILLIDIHSYISNNVIHIVSCYILFYPWFISMMNIHGQLTMHCPNPAVHSSHPAKNPSCPCIFVHINWPFRKKINCIVPVLNPVPCTYWPAGWTTTPQQLMSTRVFC